MPRNHDFLHLTTDLLGVLGAVTARAMFGGHGLYCDDVFMAIIMADKLYFKADEQSQPAFEARGLARFSYEARGKTLHIMYYEAPAEVFESPPEMQHWGQLALQAALRARKRR